jgi:TM2 domain-containing membrane protein YozV
MNLPMKTKHRNIAAFLFALLLICLCGPGLKAQTKAKIENIDFSAEGNKIIITYDIAGSLPEESFNIWIQVKTISGKLLNAKSTSGDIGKGVKGGSGKRIEWNYTLDQVTIDEEVTIEVYASLELAAPKTAETKTTEPKTAPPAEKTATGRNIHVAPALVMSAVLPGLGKVYVKGHGANWLLGVLGYGMITGSVLLNHAAYDNLQKYNASYDETTRDDFYNQAVGQAAGSYVLATGAIVIWVVDFITTGVKAGKAKRSQSHVQINSGFDHYTGMPTVGLTYKF